MTSGSSGAVVLPAVNRNNTSVLSASSSGIIAYGSRYNIYLIDIRSNPPEILDSKSILRAHRGKVISVSFCKSDNVDLLASIGDDCLLKVWDLETQTCLHSQEVREFTCHVAWIYGSANTLIYSSEPRTLSKLNVKSTNYSRIKLGSDINVSAIECHEKLQELVAVGHGNGTISIVNIIQEKTLQVLKAHSMEVTSLSWSPVLPTTLMSVSSDLTVRVWKMEDDKPIWKYFFPVSRVKMDDKKKIKPIGIFHPEKSNVVICTTPKNEVGEITFAEDGKHKVSYYLTPDTEQVKFPFHLMNLTDPVKQENNLVCCDIHKISVLDTKSQKVITQIPFLMGFVYDLTNSAVNPNLLAISNGDGILRVWNTQAEGPKLDMMFIYVHFRMKIMTCAWHPTEENILAYGSDEGRIGIADTHKKRIMYSFETHHSGPVYSLQWGPCEKAPKTDEKNDNFYLYSCGGGKVYIHKLKEFKDKSLDFDDLAEWPPEFETTEKFWTEVSWKTDFSCVCLGNFKGYIDIFSNNLVFLTRFNVQMKSVEHLCWHPENTYMSPNGSPYKFWLASCGSDPDIHIFDTSKVLSVTEGEKTESQDVFKKLVGHKKRVIRMCWSQHDDGFLVSSSRDSAAVVWNVSTGTMIANYLGHKDVVYVVHWSLFDKDVIYSGGQDSSVRVWRISDQSTLEIPDKVQCRKRLKKPSKPSSSSTIERNSPDGKDKMSLEDDADELKISIDEEDSTADVFSKGDKDSNDCPDQPKNGKKAPDTLSPEVKASKSVKPYLHFSRKGGPLFPEHTVGRSGNFTNVNECGRLADILCTRSNSSPSSVFNLPLNSEKVNDDDALKLGPFLDPFAALKLLKIRGEAMKSEGEIYAAVQLGVMAGDIKSVLLEAAAKNSLTTHLLSLAPRVSHKFWLEMCEKYAAQLVEEHSYFLASNYYLMCGKIYDAINVLADKESPIDALILARAQLPESDPIFPILLMKAAKKYAFSINKIGEAKCYLALNEPIVAAKVLASHTDPNFIRIASYICRKFNLEKDADIYAFLCLEKCLLSSNWPCFQLLLDQEPKMQVYKVLPRIQEAFHLKSKSLKNKTGIILKDLFPDGDSTNEIKIWRGNTCNDEKISFIDQAYNDLMSEKQSDLKEMLEALRLLSEKQKISTSSHGHVTIAICITEFIILCRLEEHILASQVFLKIFEVACSDKFLQKTVSFLLLPLAIDWNEDTMTFNCQAIACENEENFVLFYKAICDSVIEKINLFENQSIKSATIIKEELLVDIQYATSRMCNILLTKTATDYALSFLSASMLDCLLKPITEKIQLLKCFESLDISTLSYKTEITEPALQNGSEKENSADKDNKKPLCEEQMSLGEVPEVDQLLEKVVELNLKASVIEDDSISESEVNKTPFETTTDTVLSDLVQTTNPCVNDVIENIALSEDSEEIIEENRSIKEPLAPTHSHVKCLKSIERFCSIISFIAFNICKDEYALLYYLRRCVDNIKAAKASEVLNKFSKENKMDSKVSKPASVVPKTSLDSEGKINGNIKEAASESEELEEIEKVNQSLCESVTSVQDLSENLELQDSNPSKTAKLDEVCSSESELHKINDADNGLEVDVPQEPKESSHLMNTDSKLNETEHSLVNESLANELSIFTELISSLEMITQIRYPNPFDAIPKIIQVTYKVIENSECTVVQKKLTELIQEITAWSDKYS